jgi:hypothetical protein
MGRDTADAMGHDRGAGVIMVPNHVADDERLHRRIFPGFVRSDGSVSSQAFVDPEMSVDRARYAALSETLANFPEHGLAVLVASYARGLGQEVIADKQLLNEAHALVRGQKTKSLARRLARGAEWVVRIPRSAAPLDTPEGSGRADTAGEPA